MPSALERKLRTNSESNAALARRGNLQPSWPSESTELIRRSRQESPSRAMRAFNSSALSSDRFTFEGHSVVQALQERQLLKAASNSKLRSGSLLAAPRRSNAARMRLARPRVDISSSRVARN